MELFGKTVGLFDRLRDKVNSMKDARDPAINKCYDNICAFLKDVDHLTRSEIQTCYRAKYNEICDDTILDKALARIRSHSENGKTWYGLHGLSYLYRQDEAANAIYDICMKEYKEEIRKEISNILAVLSEHPKVKFLNEEVRKVAKKIGGHDIPYVYIAGKVLAEVMTERLLQADPTVITLVAEYTCRSICELKVIHRAYAMALRSIHFEKFGNLPNYQSITKEDCLNAAMNSRDFQKQSRDESPFEKGSVYEKAARTMFEIELFPESLLWNDLCWVQRAAKDIRFMDAACYYALQEMNKHYIDGCTSEVEKAVDLIASYISDSNKAG